MNIENESIDPQLEGMEADGQPSQQPDTQSITDRALAQQMSRRALFRGLTALTAGGVVAAVTYNVAQANTNEAVATIADETAEAEYAETQTGMSTFIESKFDDYVASLSEKDRKNAERYRDEARNLLTNIYNDVYFGKRSDEEFKQVQLTKLISFMVADRKVAIEDPERGMVAKVRPIAYADAARTIMRLECDNAGSAELGNSFIDNEWNAINTALQNARTADDFFGALTNGYYKNFGDNAYVYFNPDVLIPANFTPTEKKHAEWWKSLNGQDSDNVTALEKSGKGFQPKTKFRPGKSIDFNRD